MRSRLLCSINAGVMLLAVGCRDDRLTEPSVPKVPLADLPANSQSAHVPMQLVFGSPTNAFHVVAYTETGMSDASNGIQFGTASGRLVPHPTAVASQIPLLPARDKRR